MSQSLQKGIEALMFLSSKRSAGATEIARAINVNKSTAFRIMQTFLDFNMVEKSPETLCYKLGPAILKLSQQYYSGLNAANISKPYMARISECFAESVHLCALSNNSAVVVEQITAEGRLIVNAKIGEAEPLHCSSVGKCLLAYADGGKQQKMLCEIEFKKHTENTITNETALKTELNKIKENGYAVDDCELSEEIRCVGVPVFNGKGECAFSIGVSGAKSRMTREKVFKIASALKKVSEAISSELGCTKVK
jgi:DNA-binding IclR family transcriptional regulator